MSKLPSNIKSEKLIKALNKLGFKEYKRRGSHVRLKHGDGRWTQVAVHPGPVPKGTLNKILKEAEISIEELQKVY